MCDAVASTNPSLICSQRPHPFAAHSIPGIFRRGVRRMLPHLQHARCRRKGTRHSLAGGVIGRPLGSRRHIHHFARTRVVQLLASFLLDRLGIVLQRPDLLHVKVVLFLQLIDVRLQLFAALPASTGKSPSRWRQTSRAETATRPATATPAVASRRRSACSTLQMGRDFSTQRSASASACGTFSTMARRPSSGFRNVRDLGKFVYSKIHCLAAVLSLASSSAFAASE